jgi:phosphocarrier protein FPr
MVTDITEMQTVHQHLHTIHEELEQEQLTHRWPIQTGIMVEVPSAALLAGHFAPLVDFFSIGTNDLTQYTLAAERGNPALADFSDALHPSVLRLIEMVTIAAHQHGRWVGVCGETAGDPAAAPILAGLGVDELSMNPASIPIVKSYLRKVSPRQARNLAAQALHCRGAAEVRSICLLQ